MTPFGDKLLYRLYSLYPQLNSNVNKNGDDTYNANNFFNNDNYQNTKGNKKKSKKTKKYNTQK